MTDRADPRDAPYDLAAALNTAADALASAICGTVSPALPPIAAKGVSTEEVPALLRWARSGGGGRTRTESTSSSKLSRA